MAQKPHSEHRRRYAWCARCEHESLSPDEQARRVQGRRDAAHVRWVAAHPDRAVIRDRLIADWQADADSDTESEADSDSDAGADSAACRVTIACDRCQTGIDLLPIVDYRREAITGWRCRPCFATARDEVLFGRLAKRLSIPPAALRSLFDGLKTD